MTRRSIVFLVSGGLFACSGSTFNDVGQLGGAGGSASGGITGWTGGGPSVTGGSGGATGQAGRLVVDGTDIRAVDAHADYLYWVEYGTTDTLNNYQYNGRLLRQPLDGGQTEVISSTLSGPVGLVVTDNNAYVYLDKDPMNQEILARVPLSGGNAELVHVGTTISWGNGYSGTAYCYRGCLRAIGGQVYYSQAGSIYAVSDTSGATEAPFLTDAYAGMLDVDDTYLYYGSSAPPLPGLYRSLRTGGTPESMSGSLDLGSSLQPNIYGDYVYTITDNGPQVGAGGGGSLVLSRVGKTDKQWTNVAAFAEVLYAWPMQIAADHYFVTLFGGAGTGRLVSGSLADPQNTTTLTTRESAQAFSWVGTRLGVFWVENGKLYAAP